MTHLTQGRSYFLKLTQEQTGAGYSVEGEGIREPASAEHLKPSNKPYPGLLALQSDQLLEGVHTASTIFTTVWIRQATLGTERQQEYKYNVTWDKARRASNGTQE